MMLTRGMFRSGSGYPRSRATDAELRRHTVKLKGFVQFVKGGTVRIKLSSEMGAGSEHSRKVVAIECLGVRSALAPIDIAFVVIPNTEARMVAQHTLEIRFVRAMDVPVIAGQRGMNVVGLKKYVGASPVGGEPLPAREQAKPAGKRQNE